MKSLLAKLSAHAQDSGNLLQKHIPSFSSSLATVIRWLPQHPLLVQQGNKKLQSFYPQRWQFFLPLRCLIENNRLMTQPQLINWWANQQSALARLLRLCTTWLVTLTKESHGMSWRSSRCYFSNFMWYKIKTAFTHPPYLLWSRSGHDCRNRSCQQVLFSPQLLQ